MSTMPSGVFDRSSVDVLPLSGLGVLLGLTLLLVFVLFPPPAIAGWRLAVGGLCVTTGSLIGIYTVAWALFHFTSSQWWGNTAFNVLLFLQIVLSLVGQLSMSQAAAPQGQSYGDQMTRLVPMQPVPRKAGNHKPPVVTVRKPGQ
jgi:hypothetical protein